jgi:hypothetical protein
MTDIRARRATAVDLPRLLPRLYLRLGTHETLKRRFTLALGPE